MVDLNALRQLYRRDQDWKILFDLLAKRVNRRGELTADAAANATRIDYKRMSEMLKELAALEIGDFKLGRHQAKTRMEWAYTPQSVGLVAQGAADALVSFEEETLEELTPEASDLGELLRRTKQELAGQLGLRADQIEITIKH